VINLVVNYSVQQQNDISSEIKGMWPVIPVFQKLANSSKDECSDHSQKLLQALNNATLWAVQSKSCFLMILHFIFYNILHENIKEGLKRRLSYSYKILFTSMFTQFRLFQSSFGYFYNTFYCCISIVLSYPINILLGIIQICNPYKYI
jgi:hypothetical protein